MAAPSSDNLEKVAKLLSLELLAGRGTREALGEALEPVVSQPLRNFGKQISRWGDDFSQRAVKPVAQLGVNFSRRAANQWRDLSPTARGLLAGTAGGAALGGLSSLFRDKEERQPWSSAVSGGVAGGLLGGGLGLAMDPRSQRSLRRFFLPTPDAASPSTRTPPSVKDILKMSPEEIAKLHLEDLEVAPAGSDFWQKIREYFKSKGKSEGPLSRITALERRQRELVEQARAEGANPALRAGVGAAAAGGGIAAAEHLRRGYRTRSWPGMPSDLARGWDKVPNAVQTMPGPIADMEELARKIVQQAKERRYPIDPAAKGIKGHAKNLWSRIRRWTSGPVEIPEFQPRIKTLPTGAIEEIPDIRETARRLLQEGRADRLRKLGKGRGVLYGAAILAAIIAGLRSGQLKQRRAAEEMAKRLGMQGE